MRGRSTHEKRSVLATCPAGARYRIHSKMDEGSRPIVRPQNCSAKRRRPSPMQFLLLWQSTQVVWGAHHAGKAGSVSTDRRVRHVAEGVVRAQDLVFQERAELL